MDAEKAQKQAQQKSHPLAPLPIEGQHVLHDDGGLLHIALRGIGDIWLLGIYHLLRRIGLLRILLLRLRGIVLIQGSLHFLRPGFRTDRIAAFGTEFFIGLRTAFSQNILSDPFWIHREAVGFLFPLYKKRMYLTSGIS